jgi:unsaturated rhamnogalacturonyl hydrolase
MRLSPLLALLFLSVSLPAADEVRSAIGVTRQGAAIPCVLDADALDPVSDKPRVLLVGGLDGRADSVEAVTKVLQAWRADPQIGQRVAVSAVPNARPDASALVSNFPPSGDAYLKPETDVAHYLWRWIGMQAPDLVLIVAAAGDASAASLAKALGETAPSGVGTIPATVIATGTPVLLPEKIEPSPARQELRRRVARTPIEVATELAQFYGHKMDSVQYIPALAVVGRVRLGELTGDASMLSDAERIGAPFREGGKESMPASGNGGVISGHLLFSELARRTGDAGWTALAKKVADYGFDEAGRPKESMPFHSEMSDSVFMGCAILAEVGALTGDKKYFEQCLNHLRFMEQRCLRADGIYRHSPLDESAWGRGNGFPALGHALSLSALPPGSAEFEAFLTSYRKHLQALRKHQDPSGAWHQVVDHEESYREFTSTCMISFAIIRGMRRGWLDVKEWQPVVDKAWMAIKSRIGPEGQLVDVCTGTGKMKSLREYYDRTAILGRDERGGAMALMVSTELAYWEREQSKR